MKGTHLGELEELVLLTTALLNGNAYTVTIAQEIKAQSDRSITISTVHTSLHRLEQKGFVESYLGGTTKERGGRAKRLYRITQAGYESLRQAKELRNAMWNQLPQLGFES